MSAAAPVPPPAGGPTEPVVRLVCGIVALGALVAVLLTALVTGDSGSAVGLTGPPSGTTATLPNATPTASGGTVPPSSTSSSTSAGAGVIPSGAVSSSGATGTTRCSTAQARPPANRTLMPSDVVAQFPFPPGSTPYADHASVGGQTFCQVTRSLATVREFYRTALLPLGGTWAARNVSGSGVYEGNVAFSGGDTQNLACYLTVTSLPGAGGGAVEIEVSFRG